jgi:hypothetical protein
MPAPLSMVSVTRARGDVQCLNRGECSGHLGGRVKCSNGGLPSMEICVARTQTLKIVPRPPLSQRSSINGK